MANSQPPASEPHTSLSRTSLNVHQNRPASTEPVSTTRPCLPPPAATQASQAWPDDPWNSLHLAWRDFTFDRREYKSRSHGGEFRYGLDKIDPSIVWEWRNLAPEQRQYLADRTLTYPFPTSKDHRAYWSYYHTRISESEKYGQHPHATDASAKDFFDATYRLWTGPECLELRSMYCEHVLNENFPLYPPPLPTIPTIAPMYGEAEQRFPPSLEVTERSMRSPPDPPVSTQQTQGLSFVSPHRRDPVMETLEIQEPSFVAPHGRDPVMETPEQFAQPLRTEEPTNTKLNVHQLFEGQSIDRLEAGVAKGVEILSSIKENLESEPSEASNHWSTAINNIEKQMVRTETILGVVGATGAGKSSIINAMLDEERLVPTNCMRACTAAVTEIAYNYEKTQYRAEIDFISRQDWLKELKTSFEDLFDGNGKVAKECAHEDSEAGIAYAKIKAVYPLMSKEMMENTSIENLMDHNNVKDLLGDSHSIKHEDSLLFSKQLQMYIDGRERAFSCEKTDAGKARAKQMEFWPLIRVVRLYVKAPVLATGAVIVDLPGVHDSNQARAAVAQGYLKQCTRLWIVAPITRAVDDKSAKILLGDTFKRQLKMDGAYNSVTFICSKTDDISITEAQDSLGLDEEMAPFYARSEELKRETNALKNELEEMKQKKSDISAAIDLADEQLDIWERLRSNIEEGKTAYPPRADKASKKRKWDNKHEGARKKSKYSEGGNDNRFIVNDKSNNGEGDADNGDSTASADNYDEPLTAAIVGEKISKFKIVKKEGRWQRTNLEQSIEGIRAQIAEMTGEQNAIDGELSGSCIKGRNEYSRSAIQQDFASGIRELDQEIIEEADAANFNPEVDVRDYEEVAKSLPVFCVSSRSYQKLMGRLQKDKGISSFCNVDETGIPALQAHCKELTIPNREASCTLFLKNLSQLMNSLRLWSSSDGTAAKLTDEQQNGEAELLDSKLRNLDTALENIVIKTCTEIQEELQEHLYKKFTSAISAGENGANKIQASWGAPVNRENRTQGGLYWASYKATVRRDGVYCDKNFNNDLIEPVLKHITPGWEKVFSRRLPDTLSGFSKNIIQIMNTFHNEIEKRAIENGSSIPTLRMLKQQLLTVRESAKDAAKTATDFVIARQKDINRQFVLIITNAMLPVYANTRTEAGSGQYMRMKSAMQDHVNLARGSMYCESLSHVRQLLEKMLKDTENMMLTKLDEVFIAVKRDYESLVVGRSSHATEDQRISRKQRRTRKEVLEIVDGVELAMKRIIGLEPPEVVQELIEPDRPTHLLRRTPSSTSDCIIVNVSDRE